TLGPNFGANCALRLPDYVTIGKPGTNNAIIVANTGSVLAGNISDIFVGHNSYGDLLIVTKVTGNGTGYVIGYNVIVSFCVDNKSFYAGSNVLSFIAPNGITLTVNANGAFGGATSSYTQTVTSTNPNVSIPNSFVSLLN
ncbi:MAG: hypothetical protein J6Y94_04790, partial [Bacteriovoracaceae bacterium]|nr:hypothetical protein [Bacteriovoracaceae bacterium]